MCGFQFTGQTPYLPFPPRTFGPIFKLSNLQITALLNCGSFLGLTYRAFNLGGHHPIKANTFRSLGYIMNAQDFTALLQSEHM